MILFSFAFSETKHGNQIFNSFCFLFTLLNLNFVWRVSLPNVLFGYWELGKKKRKHTKIQGMNCVWHFFLQIFEEIEIAKRRHGKLNTIVMNAVMEACVHCGDVDLALKVFDEMTKPESCGVDNVTYGTLLKVLK